jgi:hypothetical protein
MNSAKHTIARGVIVLTAGVAAMMWSGSLPPLGRSGWVSTANAYMGAPATPLSAGGVARRTTRTPVAGAGGGGAAGAAAARPGAGVGGVGGAGAPGGGAGANRAGARR